jgi:anhydro-N-acetylmuramic acid kinase
MFGRTYVDQLLRRRPPSDEQAWADLVATVTAATARSIADAIHHWLVPRGVDEVVISGGGARNPTLVVMIRDALPSVAVATGEALGIDPDAKEAIAFAGLAWAFARGIPGNIPEATGAAGPRILGSYTPGSVGRATACPPL